MRTGADLGHGATRSERRRWLPPRLRAYLALTKPRIIELLLVTTVPAMILAAAGWPGLQLVVATLLGGTLAAASANVLNCYLDRDIDAVMSRTRRRPLVTGVVSPAAALAFGLGTGAAGVGWLALAVNPLAAGLAVAAITYYVGGYTALLKRRTPQNIVWGGAAGSMPVLIGWTAVRGRLDWGAVVLFLVVFCWTPAHHWPLALRFRADYAAAGVPMLPVVATERAVTRRIVAYSWLTVAVSLLLWPVASTGWLYGGTALAVGVGFVRAAHRLHARAWRRVGSSESAVVPLAAMRVFHWSNAYLALLFLALAVDGLLGSRW